MSKYLPYIFIILLIGYFIYAFNQYNTQISILEHNKLALEDTLTAYLTDNIKLYEKLAYIEAIHDSNLFITDSLNQKIQILTRQLIALEDLHISGQGEITIDTTIIIENCKGIVITFADSNGFYTYTDTIIVNDPPTHSMRLSFNTVPVTTYLTVDDEGLIRTVLELKGDARNYLGISNIETRIDPKFYSKYAQLPQSSLDLLLLGGIAANPELYLNIGIGVKYSNDIFAYMYGSNSSHHLIYGRSFNLWN